MILLRRYATAILILGLVFVMAGCSEDDDTVSGAATYKTVLPGSTSDGVMVLSGTLTKAGSPFGMVSDVLVPEGETLTIEPGVEILADGYYSFKVEGTLIAQGERENFINFSTAKYPKSKGDWRGVWMLEADDSSVLEYVRISYANKYNIVEDTTRFYDDNNIAHIDTLLHRGALTIKNCSPTVSRCIFDNSGYDAIQVLGNASPVIKFNTIVHNSFNGVRVEPDLDGNYGNATVANNIIVENDDSGIRALNNSATITIKYNDIWNNASRDYLPLSLGDYATGDVHLNPEFVDIESGDFTLHPCSGAIDKGDPSEGLDPDGTVVDVGALPHFQAPNELTHTLSGERLHLTNDYDHYDVTCDVTVNKGDVLVIDPGVEIRFIERFGMTINGTLIAEGTPENPIVFTSGQEDPKRADWKQILINGGTDSRISNVIIEYGSVDNIAEPFYLGALSLSGCSPVINNLTIRESYNVGLFCFDGSSPVINDINIEGAGVTGIYCLLNSKPTIIRSILHDVDGYGFKMERNCNPEIRNSILYDIGVSGIVMEELSHPVIRNVTVYGPKSNGIRLNNSCSPTILNSIFVGYQQYGLDAQVSSRPWVNYNNFYSASSDIVFNGVDENSDKISNLLSVDPQFESVDPENPDFRLKSSSNCIDAGNPDDEYKDSDGSSNDLGAFGGPDAWQ